VNKVEVCGARLSALTPVFLTQTISKLTQVADSQILEGNVESLLNLLRTVAVVPELGGDEYLLTGNLDVLQSVTNFVFVTV
jgi:hypothetical protein